MQKLKTLFLGMKLKHLKSSQNKELSNPVVDEVVLTSPEKSKYFILGFIWFLGPTKLDLTY